MRFTFFGPLKRIAGEDRTVALRSKVKLKDLMGPLSQWLPDFLPYGESSTEEQILANLSFFRENKSLRINDTINPGDTVLVVLPPTGG